MPVSRVFRVEIKKETDMFNDVLIIPESRARVMSWALPFSFGVHAVLAAA